MSAINPVGRLARWTMILLMGSVFLTACKKPADVDEVSGPPSIRLVDLFSAADVQGGMAEARSSVQWQFDTTPASDGAAKDTGLMGWAAGGGVAGLGVLDGRLKGFTTEQRPILYVALDGMFSEADLVHSVEIQARVTRGATLGIAFQASEQADLSALREPCAALLTTPIQGHDDVHTYSIRTARAINARDARFLIVQPSNLADAAFEIASVRIVTLKEHLAEKAAALGWHGLGEIHREAIAAMAPATIRFDVSLQSHPWLDLAIGTLEAEAVTFTVSVAAGNNFDVVFEQAVAVGDGWIPVRVDLAAYAGQEVSLALGLDAKHDGAMGFWGAPAVRNSGARPVTTEPGVQEGSVPPQGVVLVLAETPGESASLGEFSSAGVRFDSCMIQSVDVAALASSILTSLYPTSHTVLDVTERLPSAADTIAELFRAAGYATVSLASSPSTGQRTNLHQGFDTLHEAESIHQSNVAAREYVDRLGDWIDKHRDVPFFAFLHLETPNVPMDELWQRIKALGLVDKTVVGLVGHSGQERGTFWLVQPGRVPAGRAVDAAIQAIDVMPTLLEMCGFTLPDNAAGRSLLPLAAEANDAALDQWASRPAVTERVTTPCLDSESTSTILVLGEWKLVHTSAASGDQFALYKRGEDPSDQTDLSNAHPDEVTRLRTELDGWRERALSGQLSLGAAGMTEATSEELSDLESLGYL